MGRISPNYFVQDGVIPRTKLPEVLERIDALAQEYDLMVANVFHAGDGNLHPLVCYDGRVEGEAERAEELSGKILDACLDAGGSITGEHGVGVDKKKHMPKMFAEPDLDAFQRLRCAFDPAGLANPGKVMPTPRLCGEVPGPYRQHPLEAAGPGGAVLMDRRRRIAATIRGAMARPAAPCGPVGGGTKLDWARPARRRPRRGRSRDGRPEPDPRAQRRRLHRGAEAGVPLAEAQAAFAAAGQMLALDPPLGAGDAATVGGVVATADSGPLRHRYGGVRDLVSASPSRSSDGTVAKAGGKVIKNVAGYDLGKLFAGSYGHARPGRPVAVRLHPLARRDRDVDGRPPTRTRSARRAARSPRSRWRPTASTSPGRTAAGGCWCASAAQRRGAAGARRPRPRWRLDAVDGDRRRRGALGRPARRASARPDGAVRQGLRPPTDLAGRDPRRAAERAAASSRAPRSASRGSRLPAGADVAARARRALAPRAVRGARRRRPRCERSLAGAPSRARSP